MVVAEVMVPKGISGPEHRAYILIPHIKRQALMKNTLYILQRTTTNEHDLLVLALVLSQSMSCPKTYQKVLKGFAYENFFYGLQVNF